MAKSPDTGLSLFQMKLFFVVTLIFFKLAPENGISDWSWWWVIAPLWIYDAVIIIGVILLFCIGAIADTVKYIVKGGK